MNYQGRGDFDGPTPKTDGAEHQHAFFDAPLDYVEGQIAIRIFGSRFHASYPSDQPFACHTSDLRKSGLKIEQAAVEDGAELARILG